MIEAVIFDFDGVIFDSEPFHWIALNKIIEKFRLETSYSQYIQKCVGLNIGILIRKILKEAGHKPNDITINELAKNKSLFYSQIIESFQTLNSVAGLVPLLKRLRNASLKMAICSGSTLKEITDTLAKINNGQLCKYFDVIVSSESVKIGKPSPEGYIKAASLLKIQPSRCLVVEDTFVGITAAKSAGMQVAGIATNQDYRALRNADFIIEDFNDKNLKKIFTE